MSRKLRTGLNAETKKHLVLGEGAIFKNFNVGTDTYESARAAGKLLGACQGGSTFTATATMRNISVDGIPGEVAELDVLEKWDVTLDTTFLEVTPQTIKLALAVADTDTTEVDGYTKISGRHEVVDADYLDNITFIGTISGTNNPIILQVLNGIGNGEFKINVQNGQEATVPVTFKGKYSIDTLGEAPFEIWYPDVMNASKYEVSVTGTGTDTVTISGYDTSITATSNNTSVATVSVSSGTVTVTGVAEGKTNVIVTDSAGASLKIAVTVE